jgi:23S rRNA U2552 (ribose-2'-O)-methylase RlmE/FtsJ
MIEFINPVPNNPENQWRSRLDSFVKEHQIELAALSWGLYQEWGENGQDILGIDLKPTPHFIRSSRDSVEKLNEKVDLYTSDIGIEVKIEDMIHQETVEAQLNLGQIVCALHTLKNGGHMVCKTFLFFKPMTMSLLYILTKIFRDLYICKPVTSRPGNSEIYIVGKYYKKDENVISTLETLLYDWDKTKIDFPIEPIPKEFYLQLVYDLYYIYGRQKQFIDKNVYLVKREYEISKQLPGFIDIMRRDHTDESKKEIIIRQDIVNFWEKAYPIPKFTDIM